MYRLIVDSTRRSMFIVEIIKSISMLRSIMIPLFLLTAMTTSAIVPLSGHHLHRHQSPDDVHSSVRWTKLSQSARHARPVNVMTDVINDLGVRILDRYLDNTGNVAFSPSGLGFVLVALYEGAAGSSSREISDVLGLPRDRRITRIGLRDIHRRLRSYLNADAFLGGLTLNRDDINLRPDYEEILRFYGFDISDSGTDNDTTTPNVLTNVTDSTVSINSTMTTDSDSGITDAAETTTEQSSIAMTSESAATTEFNDAVEVVTNLTGGTNSAMSAGTDGPSSTMSMTIATMPQTTAATNASGINPTSLDNPMTTPVTPESTITGSVSSTESSTTLANAETVSNGEDINSSMTLPASNIVSVATDEPAGTRIQSSNGSIAPLMNPAVTTTMMSSIETPVTTMATNLMTASMSTMTANSTDDTNVNSTMTGMQNSTSNTSEDTATNTIRKRRGILPGPGGYFSGSAGDGIWLDEFGRFNNHDDYPPQDEDIIVNPSRPTEVAFLVNGCDYSRVTAAAYTAYLPFSYFPSLRASLLEFPLDDPRYKILVMLPSDENGTRRLARILATKSITLRNLRRSLQPTWVTAVIPSFMLRGFVTLTPYLQRLGISDVFDPRAADLTPMSPDLGVYARDIQQSIGINIRNNVKGGIGGADGGNEEEIQRSQQRNDLVRKVRGVHGPPSFFLAGSAITLRPYGNPRYQSYSVAGNPLYERAPPVPFVVDRPFLYFIIDDETSVTLLAGKIDDPLNSRML